MKKFNYFKYDYPFWLHFVNFGFSTIVALVYTFAFASKENSALTKILLILGIIAICFVVFLAISYVPIRTKMWHKK